MAYETGTASSYADMLSKLQTFCTSNGWTLSGSVLHKGSCYTKIEEITSGTAMLNALSITGGTGIDGSNNLTGASPKTAYFTQAAVNVTLNFPCNYFAHILTSPDEVYLVMRYATSYIHLCFGISPVAGISGTGGWFHGHCNSSYYSIYSQRHTAARAAGDSVSGQYVTVLPFWGDLAAGISSDINSGLDSTSWASSYNLFASPSVYCSTQPKYQYQPNSWSGEAILFPAEIWTSRGSGNSSLIGRLGHFRYLRIDNYEAEDIITIGSEDWKVYPACRKDMDNRDGPPFPYYSNDGYTGTLGFAIRYDGP